MLAPRRFLPSISSLLALEAVDRLGSASAAARELSLTQSAISRQLKALEEQTGIALVDRENMRLELTPVAREYVAEIRIALQRIAQASLKMKANPAGGTLNLSILPAFGMHWLAPRLRDFATRHPEVTLNLNTRLRPYDFAREPYHAAIHFGQKTWRDVDYLPLMREYVRPVCSPMLADPRPSAAADLLDLPLLHIESRPGAWDKWFRRNGVENPQAKGMLFDQFATIAEAAAHGLGVALLPTFLLGDDISQGRLVVPVDCHDVSLGSYYLVWPKHHDAYPPLAKFRAWLAGQTDEQDRSPAG